MDVCEFERGSSLVGLLSPLPKSLLDFDVDKLVVFDRYCQLQHDAQVFLPFPLLAQTNVVIEESGPIFVFVEGEARQP